jgi:hypothetical protein
LEIYIKNIFNIFKKKWEILLLNFFHDYAILLYPNLPCQPTIAAQLFVNGGNIEPWLAAVVGAPAGQRARAIFGSVIVCQNWREI